MTWQRRISRLIRRPVRTTDVPASAVEVPTLPEPAIDGVAVDDAELEETELEDAGPDETELDETALRQAQGTEGSELSVIQSFNLPGAPAQTRTDPVLGADDRDQLRIALKRLAPTFVIPYGARYGAAYQIPMWEPYLRAAGEPYLIIAVNERSAKLIREASTAPLIVLDGIDADDVALVLPKTLKVAFYVQNAPTNKAFLRKRRLTHVWLNHGDSDKPANFNPRHARYDRLVVSGEAGIDRYAAHGIDIPRERFDVLGRPQSEGVLSGPRDSDQPTILYAPTWRGIKEIVDFSSIPLAPGLIQAMIDRQVAVIFRPHPFCRRRAVDRAAIDAAQQLLAEDRDRTGRPHVFGRLAEKTWSVLECANRSDFLVSDVSSVVTDFLASGKPYAMSSMRLPPADFQTEFPIAKSAYVIDSELTNLDRVLDEMLGTDPLAGLRAERRTYYLGDFHGDEASRGFADYVRRLTV